jgi:hypothetical protein
MAATSTTLRKTAEPVVPLEVLLRVSHIKRAFNPVPTVPKGDETRARQSSLRHHAE